MSGWGDLGTVLGGGGDTSQAYETGRLRTAQTEGALAAARNTQLKNMAAEFQAKNQAGAEDALVAMGIDPAAAHAQATLMNAGLGSEFNSTQQGMLHQQEYGGRETLGDAFATPEQQFAAGQQVQGQVLPHYNVSGGVAEDLLNRNGSLQPTPVGQAQIGAYDALAYDRLHPQPGAAGAAADPFGGKYGKPLPGQYPNPAFDDTQPVSDTNSPYAMRPDVPQGVNQAVQQGRVLEAAAFVTNGILDFAAMPIGASTGTWGSGDAPGRETTLMSALASQAKYSASPAAIKQFNSMISTMNTALLTLETQGVRGAARLADAFNPMAFREGDGQPRNIGTLMYKAALYRQRVETGLLPLITQPSTPGAVKAVAQNLINQVHQAIPFTTVEALQWQNGQSKNPRATIGETITKAYLNKPVGGATPGTAPPSQSFNTQEDAQRAADSGLLKPGTRITVGGQSGTWQ